MELWLSGGGGGVGHRGLIIDIRGVMQKKASPDFRFPEVGISAVVRCSLVWLLKWLLVVYFRIFNLICSSSRC